MKCYGLTINLKDDPKIIEQYKAYHRSVWPEVLANARRKGMIKSKIYLLGRRLFFYFETTDNFNLSNDILPPENDAPRLKEWDDIMRGFQERVPEAMPGEWWAEMELVFDFIAEE